MVRITPYQAIILNNSHTDYISLTNYDVISSKVPTCSEGAILVEISCIEGRRSIRDGETSLSCPCTCLRFYGDTINSLIYAGNSKDVMTTKISWLVSFCDWLDLLINVIGNPYLGFVIERVLLCYFVFHYNRLTQWIG